MKSRCRVCFRIYEVVKEEKFGQGDRRCVECMTVAILREARNEEIRKQADQKRKPGSGFTPPW